MNRNLVLVLSIIMAGTFFAGSLPATAGAEATILYITNEGSNTLSVIDADKRKVIASIAVGNVPHHPTYLRITEVRTPCRW